MVTRCPTGEHQAHDVYASDCPCRPLLSLMANTWATLALDAMECGPIRFGELQRRLQGVSPKVLTQTLRRLQDAGMVSRTIYPVVPLHVEYELTEFGLSAADPLRYLRNWVGENLDRLPASGS